METESLIKWALIGVAGYFILQKLQAANALPPTGITSISTIANGPSGATAQIPTPAQTGTTKQLLAAKALTHGEFNNQGGKMTFDQWNYVLSEVSSHSVIPWEATDASKYNRNTLWSIDEYWGYVSSKGISGVGMNTWERNMAKARFVN